MHQQSDNHTLKNLSLKDHARPEKNYELAKNRNTKNQSIQDKWQVKKYTVTGSTLHKTTSWQEGRKHLSNKMYEPAQSALRDSASMSNVRRIQSQRMQEVQ